MLIPNNKKARELVNEVNFHVYSHRSSSIVHSIMDKHKCQTYTQFLILCFFRCKFLHIYNSLPLPIWYRILKLWEKGKKDVRPDWERLKRDGRNAFREVNRQITGFMNYWVSRRIGLGIDLFALKRHFKSPVFFHILKWCVPMLFFAILQDILNLFALFMNLFSWIFGKIRFKDCPAIYGINNTLEMRIGSRPRDPQRIERRRGAWDPHKVRRLRDAEKTGNLKNDRLNRVWLPPRFFNWPLVDVHSDWTHALSNTPFGKVRDSYRNQQIAPAKRRFSFLGFSPI